MPTNRPWRYGDIVRRAAQMQPLVHTYLMVIGPAKDPSGATAIVVDGSAKYLRAQGFKVYGMEDGNLVYPKIKDWELVSE